MIGWPLLPHVESPGGCVFPASAVCFCRRLSPLQLLVGVNDGWPWFYWRYVTAVHVCVCRSVGSKPDLWPQLTRHGIKTLLWQQERYFSCLSFTREWRVSRKRPFTAIQSRTTLDAFSRFIDLFSVLNDGRFIKVTNSGVSISSLLYLIILFYKVSGGENVVLIVYFIKVPLFPPNKSRSLKYKNDKK